MAIIPINTGKKKKYKVNVYVGRNRFGKEIRKTKTFDRRTDAKKWESEQLSLKGKLINDYSEERKKLVTILMEEYIEKFIKEKFKNNTYLSYRRTFDKWIIPFFEVYSLRDINHQICERFIQFLIASKNSEKNINFVFGRFEGFLNWTMDLSYITQLPSKRIIRMKPQITTSKKIRYLNKENLNKFLYYAKKSHYYDFFIFLFNSGLRISEAGALRVKDIDFERKAIHVRHNFTPYVARGNDPKIPGAFYMDSLKGHEDRFIYLNEMAFKSVLKSAKGLPLDEFVFRPKRGKLRPIIFNRGHKMKIIEAKCIDTRNFTSDYIIPMQERAGIKKSDFIGVHGTRHTFGVNFMENGGDIYTLKDILGHKSVTSTEVYASFAPEYMEKNRPVVNIGEIEDN